MKIFLGLAVVLGLFLAVVKLKADEHERVDGAAKGYVYHVCNHDPGCEQRLDGFFEMCLASAYHLSPIPGHDAVEIKPFINCINGRTTADAFRIVPGADVPFPTR